MKFKNFLLFALSGLITISSNSCKTRDPNQGKVFRSAIESDVPSLDSINVGDTTSHDVAYNIYNGLVTYRPQITASNQKLIDIVPDLAESWIESKDGKTYTFKLRKGVKFHNGREFNADDVKYTIERLANPKNGSKGLWTLGALPFVGIKKYQDACKAGQPNQGIEGIKVIDRYTVELKLEQLIPFALHVLAMTYYYVVPKEEVEKWGKDFNVHPVGTGPFMFKEWKRGKTVVLVKNPNYFEKGLPYLDTLVYDIIPSDLVRLGRFENGQLEYVDNNSLPAARFESIINDEKWNKIGADKIRSIPEIEDLSKTLIMKKPILSTEYLGMNVDSEYFKDKRVRKAFNYAVDKQKIVDRVYNGKRSIARGVLPPGFPGFNEKNGVPYPYDPDKARELLAQAGWTDSKGDGFLYNKEGKKFTMTLWYNQKEILASLCSSVQADLKDIGIDIEVRSLQWASYLDKIRKKEADFFRFGWSADYPDPDNFIWTLFSTKNIGQDNSTGYSNPVVDKLLDDARKTTEWSKREKLYNQAENIIIDDAAWIFLENEVQYKIVQPYVKGQQIHPL
ncbi:MAG: ABC transporter substrate-binding protein, partial [Candidatus Sericytochromatia bacterium]|nr:ABC transporter substrate-binding protein [Candidatus Sericytochromatia bacterium]